MDEICRKLDRRLAGLAKRHQAPFTRYADDLTFSVNDSAAIGPLLKSTRSIIEAEGFKEHEDKTRVMRRGRRQEVTGVTVNQKPSVPRDEWRQLRAILHRGGRPPRSPRPSGGIPGCRRTTPRCFRPNGESVCGRSGSTPMTPSRRWR